MRFLIITILALTLAGCCNIPIKDGGLVVGKDTTASMDGMGVARVTNQF